MILWVREAAGLSRLLAISTLDNAASIALLARPGFRETGVIRLPSHADLSRLFELILGRHTGESRYPAPAVADLDPGLRRGDGKSRSE
ncbi:MAG: hypothetical protein JOY99_16940 [Sphingomonadaceae bacterium]|nr:hypothetical protein [Sphingomonadaceae bacterium]